MACERLSDVPMLIAMTTSRCDSNSLFHENVEGKTSLGGSQELYSTMYFIGLTATALDPVQKESI